MIKKIVIIAAIIVIIITSSIIHRINKEMTLLDTVITNENYITLMNEIKKSKLNDNDKGKILLKMMMYKDENIGKRVIDLK